MEGNNLLFACLGRTIDISYVIGLAVALSSLALPVLPFVLLLGALLLSYIAYLKAKNAPIIKPSMAMISDIPIRSDKKTARIPQLSEPTISIRIAGFCCSQVYLML